MISFEHANGEAGEARGTGFGKEGDEGKLNDAAIARVNIFEGRIRRYQAKDSKLMKIQSWASDGGKQRWSSC